MTDEELKILVSGLAVAQVQIQAHLQEQFIQRQEQFTQLVLVQAQTDKQLTQLTRVQAQTDKQIQELGKQLGGLGNKFGSFTEGMAFPS